MTVIRTAMIQTVIHMAMDIVMMDMSIVKMSMMMTSICGYKKGDWKNVIQPITNPYEGVTGRVSFLKP